jgi:hypothetical protein
VSIRILSDSRLRYADLLIAEEVEFWELLDIPEIPISIDDIKYQVKGGASERVDRLATRFYGSPHLWWVIAIANGFEILPTDLNEGDIIIIPSPRFVRQEIFELSTDGRPGNDI